MVKAQKIYVLKVLMREDSHGSHEVKNIQLFFRIFANHKDYGGVLKLFLLHAVEPAHETEKRLTGPKKIVNVTDVMRFVSSVQIS